MFQLLHDKNNSRELLGSLKKSSQFVDILNSEINFKWLNLRSNISLPSSEIFLRSSFKAVFIIDLARAVTTYPSQSSLVFVCLK